VGELFIVVNWQTFEGLWGWIVGKTVNGLYILIGTCYGVASSPLHRMSEMWHAIFDWI
jgi:hypothetical protein